MIDITPKPPSRLSRFVAYLHAWDEAIHADPTELLLARIRKLEARVANLEASDAWTSDTNRAA